MKSFVKWLIDGGLSRQYAESAWYTLSPRPETEAQEVKAGRDYIRRFNLNNGNMPITVRK